MLFKNNVILCGLLLACCCFFTVIPVHAFTADSLDITVNENGDAIATFRFTLEGFIENAIPQSILEDELKKGLTTSSEPPELKSMDKSSAVLLMKKFADTSDVPTGTEYRTATMDFKKAEIALQDSAIGDAVTADFSPSTIILTFPDSYNRQFSDVDVLPSVTHIVEDPEKVAQVQAQALAQAQTQVQASPDATGTPVILTSSAAKGSINVTSSPENVKIAIDSQYVGESPALLEDIPAGTHVLEFSQEGYSPTSKNVIVNAGKTTNILVVLTYIPSAAVTEKPSSFPWLPVLVVLFGLFVIGLGGYYTWSDKKRKKKEDDDIRNGSTGIANVQKPATGRIVLPPREPADTMTRNGNAMRADTTEPDTGRIVLPPREPADTMARNGNAGSMDTTEPDTGKTDNQKPEPEIDDTGDECR